MPGDVLSMEGLGIACAVTMKGYILAQESMKAPTGTAKTYQTILITCHPCVDRGPLKILNEIAVSAGGSKSKASNAAVLGSLQRAALPCDMAYAARSPRTTPCSELPKRSANEADLGEEKK